MKVIQPRGTLASSGDLLGCHNWGHRLSWNLVDGARDTAQHPVEDKWPPASPVPLQSGESCPLEGDSWLTEVSAMR
jgi:hypothetical protein